MSRIMPPTVLMKLLEGSDFLPPLECLIRRASEILADNKLPFFPDYTDHGVAHINSVLKSQVELIPREVWQQSGEDANPRVLCDADAAVIVGATVLHDIAMHLRQDGFQQLVSKNSRFRPLPWFKDDQEGHWADLPWHELWDDYVREARRMGQQELSTIIGEEPASMWRFEGLPARPGEWTQNHCLVIGEFIRRHHARLAHEIAIYGFPGLPPGPGDGQFPAMGSEKGHALARLVDLIGVTARSHWLSLRVCKAYLDQKYPGTPRPMGTAVLYPMALLRVADYLQIDQQRAPAVLLQLRNPQSSLSAQEWQKHRAVLSVTPAIDPRGRMVTISADVRLTLYLKLRELLAGLQTEMDHATAVLDEVYGPFSELGLNRLGLATRRVYSNLDSPAFRDSLPYIPARTGFSADPSLLTLLVEPLYGKEPGVGVRELVQNAVDAVCELAVWSGTHGRPISSIDLPEQDADVLVEFEERARGDWKLTVRDKGIGMTSNTIHSFFLRAGASFRRSADWAKAFLDQTGKSRVLRAGRFGVGAFAVFLLGPSFQLCTRHASGSRGYSIEVRRDSDLIEIRHRDDLPVGTTIVVDLSREAVRNLSLNNAFSEVPAEIEDILLPDQMTDWFCWDWPRVVRRVVSGGSQRVLRTQYAIPIREAAVGPEWHVIRPPGFDAVYWTSGDAPRIVCNGLRIADPRSESIAEGDAEFGWPEEVQLEPPRIAVVDSAGNLPLTIQRYGLSRQDLPFVDELVRDVVLSFIAHALVCGPTSRTEALSLGGGYPLRPYEFPFEDPASATLSRGLARWCVTATKFVPADPWLYPLLGANECVVYGLLYRSLIDAEASDRLASCVTSQRTLSDCAVMHWHAGSERRRGSKSNTDAYRFLCALARNGIPALGHHLKGCQVIAAVTASFVFESGNGNRGGDRVEWKRRPSSTFGRERFAADTGTARASLPLESLIDALEASLQTREAYIGGMIYVAHLEAQSVASAPESPLAKVWDECLGPTAIPLDPVARHALLARGRQHPDLARHIASWEAMRSRGVVGSSSLLQQQ